MTGEENVNSGWVGTLTGRQINLDRVLASDIDILDIAAGLANQCRYAGQAWPHYSVAEHSILVSQMVHDSPGSDIRLKALLHDAPEYILNDLVRPVKSKLTGYDELEDRVMNAVAERWGLEYTAEDWKNIKRYDDLITISEFKVLMPFLPKHSYGRGVPASQVPLVNFKCLPPVDSMMAFLEVFSRLSGWKPDLRQRQTINWMVKRAKR